MVGGERLQFATGARTRAEHRLRLALVEKLLRADLVETVRALHDGRLSWAAALEADQQGRLHMALDALMLEERLSRVTARLFTAPADSRYRISMAKLGRAVGDVRVRELRRLDWRGLERRWEGSAADWNHLRRAVSRLLSLLVGKRHPLRAELVAQIPTRRELARLVDLPLDRLALVLEGMPRSARLGAFFLLATGVRLGEYLAMDRHHLGRFRLEVPGTKTAESVRDFPVDPRLWPALEAAVPCPVSEWTLRDGFHRACRAVGEARWRLHDLRHVAGQLGDLAGWPDAVVRYWLGHRPRSVSEGYRRRRPSPEDAARLGTLLAPLLPPDYRTSAIPAHPKRRPA